jgi:hypothetical protein
MRIKFDFYLKKLWKYHIEQQAREYIQQVGKPAGLLDAWLGDTGFLEVGLTVLYGLFQYLIFDISRFSRAKVEMSYIYILIGSLPRAYL